MYHGSDSDFQKALLEVINKVNTKEYRSPQIILHVFGICLKLYTEKQEDITGNWNEIHDLIKDFEELILSLKIDSSTNPVNLDYAYGGLGYHSSETKEFQNFYIFTNDHLKKKSQEKLILASSTYLQEMLIDPSDFYKRLTNINYYGDKRGLWDTPIFTKIDTEDFLSNWLKITDGNSRHTVSLTFGQRYGNLEIGSSISELSDRLLSEESFITSLLSDVEKRVSELLNFTPTKNHLKDLAINLRKALEHIQKYKDKKATISASPLIEKE